MQSHPFNISDMSDDGIDGSTILLSYAVIYSDTTTGAICLEATLSASVQCEGGVCRHMLFDRSLSECFHQGNVSVSAYYIYD